LKRFLEFITHVFLLFHIIIYFYTLFGLCQLAITFCHDFRSKREKLLYTCQRKFQEIFKCGHDLQCFPTLLVLSISWAQKCICELLSIISNVRLYLVQLFFYHCRRHHTIVCSFFLFSLSFLLSLLISSHHAREERDSEKFFFFHPRFLDGDLMELKSFRDAHRCALYSHAAWGTRRKNSLRAKKKSPDRWSTIWEINYRARRNLAEIISHGSAVVIAVVALKSLLRALAARRVSAYRYANLIFHQDSAPCPRYNYRWWFFFSI